MKVSYNKISAFMAKYYNLKQFPHERLGQAFMNHVLLSYVSDQELFYANNDGQAIAIIYSRYCDMSIQDEIELLP